MKEHLGMRKIASRWVPHDWTEMQKWLICSIDGAGKYSPDLSPCDLGLIPKMKEPLRGIRFRTVPEILQAADHSIQTINTTGTAKGVLRQVKLQNMHLFCISCKEIVATIKVPTLVYTLLTSSNKI
jgi:hypothetical protein